MPRLAREDVELYYTLSGPPDGLPVVYAPGFSAHSADNLARLLSGMLGRLGVRLLIVDHRGAGQTVAQPGAEASVAAMARDLAAAMDDAGMADAHVLGISMGGCVALQLVLDAPQRARSLTSVVSMAHAPYPSRGAHILETMRLLSDAGVPPALLNRVSAVHLLDEATFTDPAQIAPWLEVNEDPFAQTRPMWALQAAALMHWDVRDRLSAVHTPTLVFSSPDDVMVPPTLQAELAQGIAGARRIDVHGGHLFMLHPQRLPAFISDLHAFWMSVEAG
jgi:pimeloyl-ACP methyl ester carboxylesterase